MRALTIRQPWADAIVHGGKRVENRSRALPAKYAGYRTMIHAGRSYDPAARYLLDLLGLDWSAWPDERGAIIAAATITGSHIELGQCCAPWGEIGTYHWGLTDITSLVDPVPARGQLGLWVPPPDVIDAVHAQLSRTPR